MSHNTIEDINAIVHRYQNGDQKAVVELLACFNDLINKYVCILKGDFILYTSDTIKFLALFLPGQQKTEENLRHVSHFLRRLTVGWDKEDLFQQITVFIIEILHKFKDLPNINFLGFLSQSLRWRLKDWIFYEMSLMDQANDLVDCFSEVPYVSNIPNSEDFCDSLDISKLDLEWVHNCKDPLFKDLTAYERNILYHHAHGLGVESIGNLLHRAKQTIHNQLRAILEKVRDKAAQDEELLT